jgi:transcriptional antiterminator RfaH
MSENSKKWGIVQFKPNAHKIAERNLKQQGMETFLPYENLTKYKNKQFISKPRPLFPGYMFVFLHNELASWHKVNHTYGVSKLLTLNNQPQLIPHKLIVSIISQCNKEGIFLPYKQFSEGDSVRLVSGPFDNFLATVDTIDEKHRIWVLLELMGQATRTLVNAENLKYQNEI